MNIGSLVAVLSLGHEINGARRWFVIGSNTSGISVQPSEFSKIFLIIVTSYIYTYKQTKEFTQKWIKLLLSIIYLGIQSILIFLEPDAGTTLITIAIWGLITLVGFPKPKMLLFSLPLFISSMLATFGLYNQRLILTTPFILNMIIIVILFAKQNIKKNLNKELLILCSITMLLGSLMGFISTPLWDSNILKDYQRERLENFIEPKSDSNFQIKQSQVAIGSGRLTGKGFGHGTQSKLKFLPEHQTDFIFAAFAEEFGFIGSSILLLLYIIAIISIFYLSTQTTNPFGSLMIFGFGAKLTLEVFINIGMNLGLTPATGLPLPFISYGGSSLLSNFICLSLIYNIYTKGNAR